MRGRHHGCQCEQPVGRESAPQGRLSRISPARLNSIELFWPVPIVALNYLAALHFKGVRQDRLAAKGRCGAPFDKPAIGSFCISVATQLCFENLDGARLCRIFANIRRNHRRTMRGVHRRRDWHVFGGTASQKPNDEHSRQHAAKRPRERRPSTLAAVLIGDAHAIRVATRKSEDNSGGGDCLMATSAMAAKIKRPPVVPRVVVLLSR